MDTLLVLGQAFPAAATLTPLYAVPALTSAAVSTVTVANQSAVADSFRISVAVAGAANVEKQYLYFDVPLTGNNSFAATIGITLAATDVVRCRSTNGTCSFNLFGVQVT